MCTSVIASLDLIILATNNYLSNWNMKRNIYLGVDYSQVFNIKEVVDMVIAKIFY